MAVLHAEGFETFAIGGDRDALGGVYDAAEDSDIDDFAIVEGHADGQALSVTYTGAAWALAIGNPQLFKDGDPVFLDQVIMALEPRQAHGGEVLITKGEIGREMYIIEQGEVEVLDDAGKVIKVLGDGDVFGEIGVLMSSPRNATGISRTRSCR